MAQRLGLRRQRPGFQTDRRIARACHVRTSPLGRGKRIKSWIKKSIHKQDNGPRRGGSVTRDEVTREGPRRGDTVAQVTDELRRRIHDGRLLPGEKIRQDSLAEELGVSRIPVREALKTLGADGLVRHTMNSGFHVTRLSSEEFDQLYRMRRLLETEVVRAAGTPSPGQIERLRAVNDEMTAAAHHLDLSEMLGHNWEFHFTIFRMSGLDLIITEIERLWNLAMPYMSLFVYDEASRARVIDEHLQVIDLLASGDIDRAVAVLDAHRHDPRPLYIYGERA
ncbi:MAG: FCD domain-containing protein [Streptosporangiales bacterium]|nr:FCD domain-containing protein [Streptosporangiales bacterium]